MPVFAERMELFVRDFIAQPQQLGSQSDPLTGPHFAGRVVVVLREVFIEVTLGSGQVLMRDGREHTTRG